MLPNLSEMTSDDKLTEELSDSDDGLEGDTAALLKRIQLINAAIKDLDPTIRGRAAEMLFTREFGSPANPPVTSGAGAMITTFTTGTTFDSLVERWQPSTQADWALLAAYYKTRVAGDEMVTSQGINSILKDHGRGISNVTRAMGVLVDSSPALMLQVRKAGSSQQARKSYKVTVLGIKFVEDKLSKRREA